MIKYILNREKRKRTKKTIPGLRNLLETAEKSGELSIYTINKIKRDIDDISGTEDIVEISIEGAQHGRLDNCS